MTKDEVNPYEVLLLDDQCGERNTNDVKEFTLPNSFSDLRVRISYPNSFIDDQYKRWKRREKIAVFDGPNTYCIFRPDEGYTEEYFKEWILRGMNEDSSFAEKDLKSTKAQKKVFKIGDEYHSLWRKLSTVSRIQVINKTTIRITDNRDVCAEISFTQESRKNFIPRRILERTRSIITATKSLLGAN